MKPLPRILDSPRYRRWIIVSIIIIALSGCMTSTMTQRYCTGNSVGEETQDISVDSFDVDHEGITIRTNVSENVTYSKIVLSNNNSIKDSEEFTGDYSHELSWPRTTDDTINSTFEIRLLTEDGASIVSTTYHLHCEVETTEK